MNSYFINFDFTESKIKFPIEWYLYLVYFISRICNIADILKIERNYSRIISQICMKFLQHTSFWTLIAYNYWKFTDLIVISCTVFKLWGSCENWIFFDDVISSQDDVTAVQFSTEDQISGWSFGKKNFGWIGSTSCLLNLLIDTLLFKLQPLKKPTF